MKKIIICYDGTGNEYTTINTNVVKFYSLLENNENQITFYDPGVGTLNGIWGYVTGSGINKNLIDAYTFLMENYVIGDEISVVGFSRGAFTARALCGLIEEYGILKNDLYNLIPYVMEMYNGRTSPDLEDGFYTNFSQKRSRYSVKNAFLFDSVKSIISTYRYNYNCDIVDNIYHALAINEERGSFKPLLFDHLVKSSFGPNLTNKWFRGSHSDVGGGYPETGLSDISLMWMIENAKKHNIQFDDEKISYLVKPDENGMIHNSYKFPFNLLPKYKRKVD